VALGRFALQSVLVRVGELHQRDLEDGAGRVDLPGALGVKSPLDL
jgi:hypothetical protein